MRFKYLSIVSAVLAASGSVFAVSMANAADLYEKPVPAATTEQAYSWSGFYAGGEVGGAWNRFLNKMMHHGSTWVDEKKSPMADTPEGHYNYYTQQSGRIKNSSSGFIGGLFIGYNYQLSNNIVLGVDTDMIASSSDNVENGSFQMDGHMFEPALGHAGKDFNYHSSVHQKWQGSTRIRVGYALDRFLPYVAIGIAYGDVGSSLSGNVHTGEKSVYEYSSNYNRVRAGWTVGAGVDYAMTNHIMLRVEYRYTGFGSKSGLATPFYDGTQAAELFSNKVDMHQNDFRVGVAYKF